VDEYVFSSPICSEGLEATCLLAVLKQSEQEADHPPPFSVEANARSNNCTLLWDIMSCCVFAYMVILTDYRLK
jgi:hypothetical protein